MLKAFLNIYIHIKLEMMKAVKNSLIQWVVNLLHMDMDFFAQEIDTDSEDCKETYKKIRNRESEKNGLQRGD